MYFAPQQITGEKYGLNVYRWDWNDAALEVVASGAPTLGFIADEVEKTYPQHVHTIGKYKAIDYPALFTELQEAA